MVAEILSMTIAFYTNFTKWLVSFGDKQAFRKNEKVPRKQKHCKYLPAYQVC